MSKRGREIEQGLLQFVVGSKDGEVFIDFDVPLMGLEMPPEIARRLGRSLIAWAAQAEASSRIKDLADRTGAP